MHDLAGRAAAFQGDGNGGDGRWTKAAGLSGLVLSDGVMDNSRSPWLDVLTPARVWGGCYALCFYIY